MAFKGMDVDEARVGSTKLTGAKSALEQTKSSLQTTVTNIHAAWKGQDSDNFLQEWEGTHKGRLQEIIDAIEAFKNKLDGQIQEQETASS